MGGAVPPRADIPQPAPATATPPQPSAHAPAAASRPQRVCLLVDDSRMIRKVARRIVENAGYAVLEAENGEEGLARCRAAMPDLVITDWNMPVMSGIEFVTALRAIPTAVPPKVVFCTTNSGARDIHTGIEAGADEYVIKPFDEAALMSRLQAVGAA
jgi:two-component system chemotaxis response regulator CheY